MDPEYEGLENDDEGGSSGGDLWHIFRKRLN